MLGRLIGWIVDRRTPRHNPELVRTAEVATLRDLQRVRRPDAQDARRRVVHLLLLLLMLAVAGVVIAGTFAVIGLGDIGAMGWRELLGRIFRR